MSRLNYVCGDTLINSREIIIIVLVNCESQVSEPHVAIILVHW